MSDGSRRLIYRQFSAMRMRLIVGGWLEKSQTFQGDGATLLLLPIAIFRSDAMNASGFFANSSDISSACRSKCRLTRFSAGHRQPSPGGGEQQNKPKPRGIVRAA